MEPHLDTRNLAILQIVATGYISHSVLQEIRKKAEILYLTILLSMGSPIDFISTVDLSVPRALYHPILNHVGLFSLCEMPNPGMHGHTCFVWAYAKCFSDAAWTDLGWTRKMGKSSSTAYQHVSVDRLATGSNEKADEDWNCSKSVKLEALTTDLKCRILASS